jgi:o-succinylbenzoate synthase
MLDSILESLHVIELPTKTNFRGVTSREVALFEGPAGWAEFSPFLEYDAKECVPWLVCAIESATQSAPLPIRTWIPVNATLPEVDGLERIQEILSWYPGCSSIKIKVGNDLSADMQRISDVRSIAPNAKIRIDVNGSWGVDQAYRALSSICDAGAIEYVEQPCATVEQLRELKQLLNATILIAGDEVLRKAHSPMHLDLEDAVDILMLKVAPLGGISRSLELAKKHGLPIVISSALESAVGISYGIKLAAALPELDYACGLATGKLLGADVAQLPLVNGSIEVATPKPSDDALVEYRVGPEKLAHWRKRIRDTWGQGAQDWILKEGWVW